MTFLIQLYYSFNCVIPHASLLGPLLFIIYTNDFSQANSIFRFIIYVDYTTLFSIFTSFSSFTTELPNVFEWLNKN